MTDQNTEKNIDKNEIEIDLEAKLQKEKSKSDSKNKSKKQFKQCKKLEVQLEELQKKFDEQTETLKRAQNDYINLKFDLDRLQRQTQEKEKTLEVDSLISSVKKFLPFVEDLRKSLNTLSEDKKSDPLAQGVQLVYYNFLKTLELMNIKQIEAVGLVPDSVLHEPVSVQPTDDKKLKGKIIQEFERGFIYKRDDKQIVISTSKVIVGQ